MKRFYSQALKPHNTLLELTANPHSEKKPIALSIVTWPPSKKIITNSFLRLYNRIPMSVDEIKKAIKENQNSENVRLDPYGHAAAELFVDLKNPDLSDDVRKQIQHETRLSTQELSSLSYLKAYVSWFPNPNVMTGRTLDTREQLLLTKSPNDKTIDSLKAEILELLVSEFKARCSTYADDTMRYGEPSPDRVLTFTHLDFKALIATLFKMMKFQINSGDNILMNDVSDIATYYGLDMLIRNLISSLSTPENINLPVHVCTTAVLRLLISGVGELQYSAAVDEIIKSNPKLSHGLPLVDSVHFLTKHIHQLTELTSAPTLKY